MDVLPFCEDQEGRQKSRIHASSSGKFVPLPGRLVTSLSNVLYCTDTPWLVVVSHNISYRSVWGLLLPMLSAGYMPGLLGIQKRFYWQIALQNTHFFFISKRRHPGSFGTSTSAREEVSSQLQHLGCTKMALYHKTLLCLEARKQWTVTFQN
jgi:hypothetical protein